MEGRTIRLRRIHIVKQAHLGIDLGEFVRFDPPGIQPFDAGQQPLVTGSQNRVKLF